MKNILFSPEIAQACPDLCVCTLEAEVINTPYCAELWQEIMIEEQRLSTCFTPDTLKGRSGIEATRRAYRALGKDPSRYRPSNEALVRRYLQGKSLYQVNTLADITNLASIHFGYSIGGFDADKIKGETLTLGVGRNGEPYEGIGRGPLNIEFMPVYRDEIGGIGTPTSDNERTKLDVTSRRILFIVNAYDGNREQAFLCADYMRELVKKYASSEGESIYKFSVNP